MTFLGISRVLGGFEVSIVEEKLKFVPALVRISWDEGSFYNTILWVKAKGEAAAEILHEMLHVSHTSSDQLLAHYSINGLRFRQQCIIPTR